MEKGSISKAQSFKRVDELEVKKLGEQAARSLKLIGPIDIDIRKKADGQPVLFGINARLGANCLAAPEVLDALIWMWQRDNLNN